MLFTFLFILIGICALKYRRVALLTVINSYLYIVDKIILLSPKYIYIQTIKHNTIDLDFTVYEYWGKDNNKYYNFNVIEDNIYDSVDAFKIYNSYNRMLLNHCCVLDENDDYIKDITKDIRKFMYYKGLIEWKYIIVHLGIEGGKKIKIYMNDIDMSEKVLDISDIYNKKFNF